MSLFSAIGSLLEDDGASDSIGDDNAGVATAENNSFVEATVFGARKAYETMHFLVAPLIKGKNASLRTIDRQLKAWEKRLDKIVKMYEEMLNKLNDLGADFTGTMTLDAAKEAWEILQDTPILRRYMGEANYWYLYDMMGLLATQTGSMSADMVAGAKAAIKATVLALISMTDGMLCLQTYIAMIQQWWGALYVKIMPLPLLDSIVPNVTTAYWYKPAIASQLNGYPVSNNPPGKGFCPIPLPMPDPIMVTRDASYITQFDYQNPETWYLNGTPYYLPNTMQLLQQVLNYWGSSYTDAFIPGVNNFYPRRDYDRGNGTERHPLITCKTFAQLDTSKTTINGTDIQTDANAKSTDVSVIFGKVVTDAMKTAFEGWQSAYIITRIQFINALQNYIAYKNANGQNLEIPKTLTDLYNLVDSSGVILRNEALQFIGGVLNAYDPNQPMDQQTSLGGIVMMNNYWGAIANAYATENNITDGTHFKKFYDAMMKAFVDAGQAATGYKGSLDEDTFYMTTPSFVADNLSVVEESIKPLMGIPGLTFVSSNKFGTYNDGTPKNAYILLTSKGDAPDTIVEEGDGVQAVYHLDKFAFVMLPSTIDMDMAGFNEAIYSPHWVPNKAIVNLINVPAGKKVNEAVGDTGTVLEYIFAQGMNQGHVYDPELGTLTEALYKHQASGPHYLKGEPYTMGSVLFPDGNIPANDEEEAQTRPETFVSIYNDYMARSSDANEELADIIGYSIDKGREIKFPCFGVYGNLLSMKSFNYKEMPSAEFNGKYAKTKSGTDLYYLVSDPSKIVFRHSSYMSQSRATEMTIYHEPLETESKSYGSGDAYKFHIFPTESITVSTISESTSLGQLLSVDAEAPDGTRYHYITFRNPIPKCAKYVNPEYWSIMDLIHEMLLLAQNLSGLCADNGKAYKQLMDDLSEFHVSSAELVGQLPENNGQFVTFRFGIFQDYADRIEKFVNSVYDFRAKIIAATEAW